MKSSGPSAHGSKFPGQKSSGPRQTSLVELRRIAVRALAEVFQGGRTIDDAILFVTSKNSGRTLAQFDRSWLVEIVSGVVRYRGRVDYIIDTYALKKKPTGPLRRYLQTAVYQLISSSQVEPALLVSETVQAVRENEGEPPSKFANAILRKVAEQREHWKNWKVNEKTPRDELLAWSSLPKWLFDELEKSRGLDWTLQFAEASLERPRTWFRRLDDDTPLELMEGYQGDEVPGYVQDRSNQELVQKVVLLLKEKKIDPAQAKILDLCAAPGGKTLGLAVAGFGVVATDLDANRLSKVEENRNRLQLQNKITIRDYSEIQLLQDTYDVIWIDAPCSSTGILRRHPEIRWNREASQIQVWVEKQQKLIEWSKARLNSGGLLIYSTCSVLAAENRTEIAGMPTVQKFERVPQEAGGGDGIYAIVASRA